MVSITNDTVTTKIVGGSGAFDAFAKSLSVHLKEEFEAGRIMGAEYTKAYIAMMQTALSGAIQFALSKDKAGFDADAAQYNVTQILPSQKALVDSQKLQVDGETTKTAYEVTNILPSQKALIDSQKGQVDAETSQKTYETANILPEQKTVLQKQQANIVEQTEAQRAQTMDTRLDGVTPVAGVLGKQKLLYAQQITSYQRDAEVKAAKMFVDAWITQKTIDEGLLPPTNFQNTSLDAILADIKTNNAIG